MQALATDAQATPPAPTSWWRQAVIYHLLVDRFAAAATTLDPSRSRLPVFCGGTLDGVTRRLDYLRGLGVNTLWLSPVTASAAYHGYHVLAYDRVEPRFGGERAWDALMRAARPDFRILLDWVPNHIHREHPFFQQAIADPHSPYREWFHFGRDGRPLCFLHFDELPKLNLDHPDVRSYLLGECKRWLDRVIAEHPTSKAADTARKMLELNK